MLENLVHSVQVTATEPSQFRRFQRTSSQFGRKINALAVAGAGVLQVSPSLTRYASCTSALRVRAAHWHLHIQQTSPPSIIVLGPQAQRSGPHRMITRHPPPSQPACARDCLHPVHGLWRPPFKPQSDLQTHHPPCSLHMSLRR
ncbi:hypothetical protein BV20DRAFT_975377 [Pilatotrama ljubarskyi]|nr:hypothetical protein BV20DRAFT_975377 [Pilatotrama ljubarskyi]